MTLLEREFLNKSAVNDQNDKNDTKINKQLYLIDVGNTLIVILFKKLNAAIDKLVVNPKVAAIITEYLMK